MLSKLKNLLSDEPSQENIDWVHSFLREHHSRIIRKPYSRDYELFIAITFVFRYLARTDQEIYEYILENNSNWPDQTEVDAALYSKATGIGALCTNSKIKKFKNPIQGFGYCGTNKNCQCFMTRPELYDAQEMQKRDITRQATMLEKYGVTNAMQLSEIREKISHTVSNKTPEELAISKEKAKYTNLQKYGVYNPFENEEVKKKITQTVLEKYGVDNVAKHDAIKQKAANTLFERTGYDHVWKNPKSKERMKQTYIDNKENIVNKIKKTQEEKYGTWFSKTSEFKEKSVSTNRRKYGVENLSQCPEVRKKIVKTNIETYGTKTPAENTEVRQKIIDSHLAHYGCHFNQQHYSDLAKKILFNEDEFRLNLKNESLHGLAESLNVDLSTIYNYCKIYNITFDGSSFETSIAEFLQEHGLSFSQRTRALIAPLEIDFYIEEHNLAIEFNGIYWHSDKFVANDYHKIKHQRCVENNIRLIMINEDEWLERSEVIKKKILNICGKSEKGVGARKLNIQVISNKEAAAFVALHHIQGSTNSYLSYGAYDGTELVAVMMFAKQRITQDIELVRFCTDGKTYAGAFSRMFKKFVLDHPEVHEVISFADLRYSEGNLYEKCGFTKDKIISQDYRYVKGLKTFHKSLFKKSEIARKFGIDVSVKTEKQLMEELGYNRIYDCGKIRYTWHR